jgi:DNA-binding CsgD family transcriptional regulator
MNASVNPEHLIDRIYEAGLIPSLWPTLLGELGAAVGGNGGFLFGVRDGYTSAVNSVEYDQLMPVFLGEGWSERDPLLPRAIAVNHAGFVTDHDLLSEEEIATNEVYGSFYRKHGIGYRAGTLIPMPIGDSVALVLPRHQDRGPVPREVVHLLDGLRPHLARASLAANRLGFERALAQVDSLQALGLPGAVLRGPGRILAVNGMFNALVPALFQDRSQRVAMTDLAADVLLAEALGSLSQANSRSVKSIPVAATAGQVPMVLHVIPVRGSARDVFSQASALLVVTPVDRAAVPTAEVLQGLFDRTPAEARVARGIGQAETIDTLAVATGVNRETVRSQLKAVLSKTGLSRQQELVSLLAGKAFPGG